MSDTSHADKPGGRDRATARKVELPLRGGADTHQPPRAVGEGPPATTDFDMAPPLPPEWAAAMAASQQASPLEAARDLVADESTLIEEHVSALGPGFVRTPFGQRSMRLAAPRREGFHRHWFNDTPGRLARAFAAGYKVVNNSDGKPIKQVVSVSARGDGEIGVLMEIPIAWFLEDQAAQKRVADELEATIRRGEVAASDGSHRYVPREGIEVKTEQGGSHLPRQ